MFGERFEENDDHRRPGDRQENPDETEEIPDIDRCNHDQRMKPHLLPHNQRGDHQSLTDCTAAKRKTT